MSEASVAVLEARIALLERRLQLVSDEFATVVSRLPTSAEDDGDEQNLPLQLRFEADSLSQFAQGFYEREYDAQGISFRWTGNGPLCELRFFIDRTKDQPFVLDVGETPAEILSPIKAFVDYAPVELSIAEDGARSVLVGAIPKRSYTRLAVITFLLGSNAPKKKGDGPVDWMGFQFYSLSVG
jgi:hypothetical protein